MSNIKSFEFKILIFYGPSLCTVSLWFRTSPFSTECIMIEHKEIPGLNGYDFETDFIVFFHIRYYHINNRYVRVCYSVLISALHSNYTLSGMAGKTGGLFVQVFRTPAKHIAHGGFFLNSPPPHCCTCISYGKTTGIAHFSTQQQHVIFTFCHFFFFVSDTCLCFRRSCNVRI